MALLHKGYFSAEQWGLIQEAMHAALASPYVSSTGRDTIEHTLPDLGRLADGKPQWEKTDGT